MANKISAVTFLAAISALSVGECGQIGKRQTFPEQFSQLTNKFQETFKPSAGNFPNPPFQLGQFPSGFPNPSHPSRRQLDAGQFSQLTNNFQEAFKPLTENSHFSFGGFPTGNPLGSGGFFEGQMKRMSEVPAADGRVSSARAR